MLIPLLFMGDVVGRLFREFAITLAGAILISAFVSLTLTPMMSAKLLRHVPESEQGRFERAAGRFFDAMIARYATALDWVLERQRATLVVAVLTLVLTIVLYIAFPKGFFPTQDTGQIQGGMRADQSISFQAMQEKLRTLVNIIRSDPAVDTVVVWAAVTVWVGGLGISSRPTMLPTAVMATINAICLPSWATSNSMCRVHGATVRSR